MSVSSALPLTLLGMTLYMYTTTCHENLSPLSPIEVKILETALKHQQNVHTKAKGFNILMQAKRKHIVFPKNLIFED